jgi:hypothetical protein
MNLICFPHYSCGGLLCDIFEDKLSPIQSNKGIGSFSHSFGNIGDSNTVFKEYDVNLIMNKLVGVPADAWAGTHCHPHLLDVSKFNKVLLVTTSTTRSKIYRWTRAYYHYFLNHEDSMGLSGIDAIDKFRETAKNYLIPFEPMIGDNVTNIEFAEVVDQAASFKQLTDNKYHRHMDRWMKINYFLYDANFWNSEPVKRFYEAEYEDVTKTSYMYV